MKSKRKSTVITIAVLTATAVSIGAIVYGSAWLVSKAFSQEYTDR